MLVRDRLLRSWFMEFEFFGAGAAIGWAAVAYGTVSDMAQRPSLGALRMLSDDQWALTVGLLGILQMVCVVFNTRWGRWALALPLSFFWSLVSIAIAVASCRGEPLPLSAALYAWMAICMLLVVVRLPREYPPRGR